MYWILQRYTRIYTCGKNARFVCCCCFFASFVHSVSLDQLRRYSRTFLGWSEVDGNHSVAVLSRTRTRMTNTAQHFKDCHSHCHIVNEVFRPFLDPNQDFQTAAAEIVCEK